jgi:hypothetical protein
VRATLLEARAWLLEALPVELPPHPASSKQLRASAAQPLTRLSSDVI